MYPLRFQPGIFHYFLPAITGSVPVRQEKQVEIDKLTAVLSAGREVGGWEAGRLVDGIWAQD